MTKIEHGFVGISIKLGGGLISHANLRGRRQDLRVQSGRGQPVPQEPSDLQLVSLSDTTIQPSGGIVDEKKDSK